MASTTKIALPLLSLACIACYANTFDVPFHWDGVEAVEANPIVKSLDYFAAPLEAKVHWGHFEFPSFVHRYVTYLTFALNYRISGNDLFGFHAVNLLIHLLNSLLLYWLLTLLLRTPRLDGVFSARRQRVIALFAGLLFACHPLQTQAVTYIWQRSTALAATWYLLSAAAYLWWRLEAGRARRMRWAAYAVSLVAAVLAMKTKENAFTLPVAVAAAEVLLLDGRLVKRIAALAPLVLTMLIVPLTAVWLESYLAELGRGAYNVPTHSRLAYFMTQCTVILTYLRLLVFPAWQNLDYDRVLQQTVSLQVVVSLLALACLLALALGLAVKRRGSRSALLLVSYGILLFFITLSVESSFIPINDLIHEHRMYLPMIGALIAVTVGAARALEWLRSRWPAADRGVIVLGAACVVTLAVATYLRNEVWRDGVTLWEDVVRKSPNKPRSHINLGLAYKLKREYKRAEEHYRFALVRMARDGRWRVYWRLGRLYAAQGHWGRAVAAYRQGLLITDEAKLHLGLAKAFQEQRDYQAAIKHFRRALARLPHHLSAHMQLGGIYGMVGQTSQAIAHLERAAAVTREPAVRYCIAARIQKLRGDVAGAVTRLRMALRHDPDHVAAHMELAEIYSRAGQHGRAIEHYERVAKAEPELSMIRYNLGNAYMRQGLPRRAIEHYRAALATRGNDPALHNNLSLAYRKTGQLKQASFHRERARQLQHRGP